MSTIGVVLRNPTNGSPEQTWEGFSWPAFLFGVFWLLVKGLYGHFLISLLILIFTFGFAAPIVWIAYGFIGNGAHKKSFRKKGYLFPAQWEAHKATYATSTASSPHRDHISQLRELAEVRDKGVLTSVDHDATDKDQTHRACPFCAERIKRQAIVCRYCNRDVVPLVHRECGSQVSESVVQYPKCEVEIPTTGGSGQLTIHRASRYYGFALKLKVIIDGQAQGALKNGEKMTVDLSSGKYILEISNGLLKGAMMVNVHGGISTVYSVWPEFGLFGSRIRFELA